MRKPGDQIALLQPRAPVCSAALSVVPITQRDARAFVSAHHRHLSAPRGDILRAALALDGEIVGVALAGRPSARMLDDGRTLEVTRVAVVEGISNGCSKLYGALRRAAVALGWARIYTYTLPKEPGTSLRAAGFVADGWTGGGEWSREARPRAAAERSDQKRRWVWPHTERTAHKPHHDDVCP